MAHYADELSLAEARANYFAANHFPADGGYSKRWVRIELGPIALAFPNTAPRVRAVRFHDLHHVATGYETDLRGEAEIGAWEIASGCADHLAAWVLNLWAMWIGLLFWPRAIFRAFTRGRRSRNLYRASYDDRLLSTSVGETRHQLQLDQPEGPANSADRRAFAFWSVIALLCSLLGLALLLAPFLALAALLF